MSEFDFEQLWTYPEHVNVLLYKIIIWRFSDSGTTLLNVICIPQISCGFAAFFSPANCIAQEPLESTAEDIILLQSFG